MKSSLFQLFWCVVTLVPAWCFIAPAAAADDRLEDILREACTQRVITAGFAPHSQCRTLDTQSLPNPYACTAARLLAVLGDTHAAETQRYVCTWTDLSQARYGNGSYVQAGNAILYSNGYPMIRTDGSLAFANGRNAFSGDTAWFSAGSVFMRGGQQSFYPHGGVFRNGLVRYYPSGAMLSYGSMLYYPSGTQARSNGILYYANGVMARMGNRLYCPNQIDRGLTSSGNDLQDACTLRSVCSGGGDPVCGSVVHFDSLLVDEDVQVVQVLARIR